MLNVLVMAWNDVMLCEKNIECLLELLWMWKHVNIGGYPRCLKCNAWFYGYACVWCGYCVIVTASTGTANMCMNVILGI